MMLRSTLRWLVGLLAGVLGLVVSTASLAASARIDYELFALAAPGRYEYHYTLTNVSSAAPLSWFSVDFDTTLYQESTLHINSSGLSEWSEQILASVLTSPAQYDAYKTSGAGLNIGGSQIGFTVEFTWLGGGVPGSQSFTLYDPATLNIIDSGLTTALNAQPPGVPEPTSAVLALLALSSMAARRGRRSAAVAVPPVV